MMKMSAVSKYLKKLNTERCEQLLIYIISAVVCIWTIIPTLKIAKYSYPVQDDFAYMTNIRNYMEQGNGVIKACILQSIDYYKHFVGAYSSSFLGHLFEHIIQGHQTRIACFEIASIIVFDVALLLFCYGFIKLIFGYKNVVVAGVYAVMLSFINNVIYYSDSENYYWLVTSIQYLLLLSFSLVGVFLTIMSVHAKRKGISVAAVVIGSICAFIAAGSNLCLSFINIELIVVACVALYAIKRGKKTLFIPFAAACVGTFINGIAPGNYERKGDPVTPNLLIHSVMDSFKYSYERVEKMFSKPLFVIILVIMILLLLRYSDNLTKIMGSYRLPVVAGIVLWCGVALAIFPGILGYGFNIYGILMRGNFLSDFMIYTAFLLESIYVVGWLKNKYFEGEGVPVRLDIVIIAALIVVFGLARLRDDEWRWTPVVRMYREISSGKMQEYSDYVWSIYNHLQQDEEEEIVLYIDEIEDKTCMISPYFAYGDHDENYKNYDASIVRYYGKKALYLYNAEDE